MTPSPPVVVLTPEGTELHFVAAAPGERLTAFIIDVAILLATVLVVVLLLSVSLANAFTASAGLGEALFFLFWFAARHGYFAGFEIAWQGQTPGKRSQGLRVISARGGALRAESLLARNLMRELEFFLPLTLAIVPEAVFPGVTGGARTAATVWGLCFLAVPLFHRRSLRIGDLLADTCVVRVPKTQLLDDLGASSVAIATPGAAPAEPQFAFQDKHLRHYGIFELQKLEELLRNQAPESADAIGEVARKIARRVGWPPVAPWDARPFLQAFYTAQRRHLEQRAVMGDRVADKDAARRR